MLYPADNRPGPDIATLLDLDVRFFVARLNGLAIGCGGYVPRGSGLGELKRMFVMAETRGKGIGRSLLEIIEAEARRDGIRVMQLETGIKSVEARGLYTRLGYRERGPFGGYDPDPLSVFMEKELGAGAK